MRKKLPPITPEEKDALVRGFYRISAPLSGDKIEFLYQQMIVLGREIKDHFDDEPLLKDRYDRNHVVVSLPTKR